MAINKWYRLTPNQIKDLNKDTTVVIIPLGTMGSFDPSTRVWEDYKTVREDAESLADTLNDANYEPLAEFKALSLLPLTFGIGPEPTQPGTVAVPRDIYESVLEAICSGLANSGLKYVVLVNRDDKVNEAAGAVAERLNETDSLPQLITSNSQQDSVLFSATGDRCRWWARFLGLDPASCPP